MRYFYLFFIICFFLVSCFDEFESKKKREDTNIENDLSERIRILEEENRELKLKIENYEKIIKENGLSIDQNIDKEKENDNDEKTSQKNSENLPQIFLNTLNFYPVNLLWKFEKDRYYYQVRIPNRIRYLHFVATGEITGSEIAYSFNGENYRKIESGKKSNSLYINTGLNNLYIRIRKSGFKDNYYKIAIIRYEDADLKDFILKGAKLDSSINVNKGSYKIYTKSKKFIGKIIKYDNKSKFFINSKNIDILDNKDKTFTFTLKDNKGDFVITMRAVDGYKRYYYFEVILDEKIQLDEKDLLIEDKQIDKKIENNMSNLTEQVNEDIIINSFKINSIKNYEYELELIPKFNINIFSYQLVINRNVVQIGILIDFDSENINTIKIVYNNRTFLARRNRMVLIDLVENQNEVVFYVNKKEYKINISYLY